MPISPNSFRIPDLWSLLIWYFYDSDLGRQSFSSSSPQAYRPPTTAAALSFGSSVTLQSNPLGQQNNPPFTFGAAASTVPAFGVATSSAALDGQRGGLLSSGTETTLGPFY